MSTVITDSILAAPNPNTGDFDIIGDLAGDVSVAVSNSVGEVVYRATIRSGRKDGHVSLPPTLPAGVYLLVLSSGADRQAIQFKLSR